MKLGFLSDAHGNEQAFLQAMEVLQKQKVEEIYFLGDAIGYFDNNCIPYYLQSENIKSLRGNHEEMVIKKNVPPEKEYIYRLTQHYDTEIVPIISSWAETLSITVLGKTIHMAHGSLKNPIWGYTHENEENCEIESDLFVCGATHRPFVKNHNGKIIANNGSCGFPRDRGTEGACGIYDACQHSFSILRFDISASIESLKKKSQNIDKSIMAIWERR